MMINISNNSNISVVLLCLVLLVSCKEEKREYYYAYYTKSSDKPEAYIIKKVETKKDRKETDFMYTTDGKLKSKSGNIFKVTDAGLKKLVKQEGKKEEYEPFLCIVDTECVNFMYKDKSLNDFAATSFCFICKEDLVLNNNRYSDIYKFIKKQGAINKVTTEVYLDSDFILIQEEFVEGERPYFKIERIDKILNFE